VSATLTAAAPPSPLRLSIAGLQKGVLWLLVFSGGFAVFEPSPYEIVFMLAALVFALTGLRFNALLAPLFLALILFSVGGLLSLIPWIDNRDSVIFVIITFYVTLTAMFFSCVMLDDPQGRLNVMRGAFILSAVCASIAGILGYFDVAGLAEPFTKFSRATGTFKDPNVLGPFLVPPLVWLTQGILLRERVGVLRTWFPLLIVVTALFLTFSRGAWGVAAASVLMMVGLTFITTRSSRLRLRIIGFGILGLMCLVLLFAVALSIPAIREIYDVRASLSQDYDLGEFGRFGAQLRAIPMLLERPLGFGPLQFRYVFFGEDPHNVFINAFASYGWLGGLAFFAVNVMTMYVGWWLAFQRNALQPHAITLWSCLFIQLLQGFQIDTDHWRHLWLLMGCVWGLTAYARMVKRQAYLRATA
jgi:O-Antigen ligase